MPAGFFTGSITKDMPLEDVINYLREQKEKDGSGYLSILSESWCTTKSVAIALKRPDQPLRSSIAKAYERLELLVREGKVEMRKIKGHNLYRLKD